MVESMCVYVQMHMYVWVRVHVCVHHLWKSELNLRHNSSGAIHLIFDTGSLTEPWHSTIRLERFARELRGVPCQYHYAWIFFFFSKLRTEDQTCTGSMPPSKAPPLPRESPLKNLSRFEIVFAY